MKAREKPCLKQCKKKTYYLYYCEKYIIEIQAKQKRNQDQKQRHDWNYQENHEVNYTISNDFMTENPNTTKSQLADHRVKPYHFKGLTDEQKTQIMFEREHQVQAKN